MAYSINNISKTHFSEFVWLVATETGEVLYADPDIAEKLQSDLPNYKGLQLNAYLPTKEPILLQPHSLAEAASSRTELACNLRNGLRLLLSVRKCHISPQMLIELIGANNPEPLPSPLEEALPTLPGAWMLFGMCEDHRMQKFQIETRMRTTIASIIAGFAHEVRNPLAAILSLAEGVIHPNMEEETLRALTRIPFLVERIENLIKTALSYGKPRPPKAEWHKIGTLLTQSAEILNKNGSIPTEKILPGEYMSQPVFADQDHIISILTNLMQNAIQEAGTEQVRILIRPNPVLLNDAHMYCRPPALAVDIIDQGAGIDPSIHEAIFEPFFTTKSDGTGLGLAFARELARLNAGEVLLLESSIRGSIFRVYLPTSKDKRTQPSYASVS